MSDWLTKLFARSPFGPFQDHMRKVQDCLEILPELVEKMKGGDLETIREVAKRVSQAEFEADEIKNEVRAQLPKTKFLPVDRGDLLEVLHIQDAIADSAEDVAVLATMRPLKWEDELEEQLDELLEKVLKTSRQAGMVVESLDELVESSFSNAEVKRLQEELSQLGEMEHEADKIQDKLVRNVYRLGEQWSPPDFYLWMRITRELGEVANAAERMGNRLRTFVSK